MRKPGQQVHPDQWIWRPDPDSEKNAFSENAENPFISQADIFRSRNEASAMLKNSVAVFKACRPQRLHEGLDFPHPQSARPCLA